MGPEGDNTYDAVRPAVTWNSTNNQYHVVWEGEVGANDFRISDMGPDGNDLHDAHRPRVTYNVTDNEYYVVWYGDDVDGEFEVYGQRIAAGTGAELGANDVRLSDMGPEGNTMFAT